MRSLRLRLILLAASISIVALVVAGVIIAGLLREFVDANAETTLNATMVALMANTEFDPVLQRIQVDAAVADPRFEQPFSGWYWEISDPQRVLLQSGSLWTKDLAIGAGTPDGQVHRETATGPKGEMLIVYWRNFTVPGGGGNLRVYASTPAAILEAQTAEILRPLIVSLALLGVVLIAATALQVYFGLRPLSRLRRSLEHFQQGQATQVFGGHTEEIAPIADQINLLLKHSTATIERARTHIGNLAHGLKTPLATLNMMLTAESLNGKDLLIARDAAAAMSRLISHHLGRARSAATAGISGSRTPVLPAIDALLPVFRGIYAERAIDITVKSTNDMVFAGDQQDLDELLGNLIDNACKWADHRVTIGVRQLSPDRMTIEVSDDGPGMTPAQAAEAIERGRRFDEGRSGTGLGLAIVADLVQLYGGTLTLKPKPDGGLQAALVLPALPV